MFPRYFVSSAAGPQPLPTLHLPLIREILDFFRCPRLGGEVVVASDAAGQIHLLDDPSVLPASLLADLHRHELGRGPARTLDVRELWIFELSRLEQPPGVPGVNDPVHLEGRLYGPWGTAEEPQVTEGVLTVTRCDAIAGIVEELPHAFPAEDGSVCHLLLPAAPPADIADGHGVVLAWPLPPGELSGGPSGNDVLTGELLYDLLLAFQEDVGEGGLPHPLATTTLPVPDRAALVAAWEADGWAIEGKSARKGSFFRRETRVVPEEGSLTRWAPIASATLSAIPGWPSDRAVALREKVRVVPVPGVVRVAPSGPPRTPRPSSPPDAPAGKPPAGKPPAGKPEWMNDFASPPAKERPSRIASARGKTPHWMRDFES